MTVQQLQAKMKQLAREMEYEASDMKKLAEMASLERKKGFERGEGPDGEKWKDLEFATIMRKMGAHSTLRAKKGELVKGKVKRYGTRMAQAAKKGQTAHSPQSPLIDTGNLMNPTTSATKHEGRVHLAKSRAIPTKSGASISEIHDKGMGNNPVRHHWAIYAKARQRIQTFHKARFRRICRSIFGGIK